MDDRLKQLLILYDEATNDENAVPVDSEEIESFETVKRFMDARPNVRPRPSTVRAVMDAAAAAGAPPRATDRSPRRRARDARLGRHLVAGSIVLAATLSVVILLRIGGSATHTIDPGSEPPAMVERTQAPLGLQNQTAERSREPMKDGRSSEDLALRSATSVPDAGFDESLLAQERRPVTGNGAQRHVGAAAAGVVASAATTTSASVDLNVLNASDQAYPEHPEDLFWDHADDMRRLFEHVERLDQYSPTGNDWYAAPAGVQGAMSPSRRLTAPIGLVAPQHASMRNLED